MIPIQYIVTVATMVIGAISLWITYRPKGGDE